MDTGCAKQFYGTTLAQGKALSVIQDPPQTVVTAPLTSCPKKREKQRDVAGNGGEI